jgi:hypothetical protein
MASILPPASSEWHFSIPPQTIAKENGCRKLPQVGETNTPRLMDAEGECLLYYEIRRNVSQIVRIIAYRDVASALIGQKTAEMVNKMSQNSLLVKHGLRG